MADRGDGPRSRYLIGRNTRNSKVAGGRDSPPPGACELRCSRQPKRATIATADYVGVWRPGFALVAHCCRDRSTVSPSPAPANGASAPCPQRIALRVLLEVEARLDRYARGVALR